MNRRRYESGRFDKTSERKDYTNSNSYSRINSYSKDEYRGRYGNSSKYLDDNKYSRSFKRQYKNTPSRNGDHIKRSRNDDSRQNSSFISPRRNDLRPKTPPPPSIRSTGNSYHRGSSHRNESFGHSYSYRSSFSPSRKRSYMSGGRNTSYRYNNSRLRQNSLRESDNRPRVIRRKLIVSASRKINTLRNDRTRMLRLTRIKRNKDSLKVKSTPSKKSKEAHSVDEKKMNTSSNECENEENKSSKKSGQDVNEKNKEIKNEGEMIIEANKSKDKEENVEEPVGLHQNFHSSKQRSSSPERSNKTFIKLICVHCRIKCRTFSEYQSHLYSRTHRIAMRRVAIRQKAQLSRMRLEQRKVQRDLEENVKEDLGEQQYCLLCRLNYKTGKAKHQLSDHHKIMKKFLMPYCSTCHIAFKSPIVYQSHRCSLEHIKRKARDDKSDSEDSGSEMKVDLKEFTTVDSIGEIDEEDIEESDVELDYSVLTDELLGLKFVKKVEALYCETCEVYIEPNSNNEEAIYKHCRTKLHLRITKKILESEKKNEPIVEKEGVEEKTEDNGSLEDGLKSKVETEESNQKMLDENNEEDDDEEPILNIDIQSDKNCTGNEIIEEATSTECN